MGKNVRKNLIKVLLPVLFAVFTASLVAFGVNIAEGKKPKPVPFSQKLVLNLSDKLSAKPAEEECAASVTLQYAETFTCAHKDIETEEELAKHRAELKAYYMPRNEKIVKDLNLENCADAAYSYFGPYIEYRYDSADDFLTSDLALVQGYDSVTLEKVYVEEYGLHDDAIRNGSRSNYDFTKALADIGIYGNKEYTGKGVKVGIIESGVPNNTINLKGVTYETYGTNLTSHSFQTSSIIGANSGIATDAELYFAALEDYKFVECSNWFIEKGVNVINRSNGGATGTYNVYSAYADYLVRQTKVTFINSAGNDGDTDISGYPGTGLNVISVASNDWNKAISSFSSAGMQSGQTISLANPTLTAPGGSLSGIPNVSGAISGTSFSAPMVTGVVALLMEEFPELKLHPENVMALLTNTCNPAKGQTEIWDHDAGFGIVDYSRARNYYRQEYLKDFNVETSNKNGDTLYTATVQVPFGGTLTAKAALLVNCYQENTDSTLFPTYSKIIISVRNVKTGEIAAYGETISNYAFVEFLNETYATEDITTEFSVSVYLNSAKGDTEVENCALSVYAEEAEEPFGLVFSDGVYVEDGDSIEQGFYYEVVSAGYEIEAVYVFKPNADDWEEYTPRTEIAVNSVGGEYTFYFEYDDGCESDFYTVYLDVFTVEIFRDDESVFTVTLLADQTEIDSGQYFKLAETLTISVISEIYGECSLEFDEEILITEEDFGQGEYEIIFTLIDGSEVILIIHITHDMPRLSIDDDGYEDGSDITYGEDVTFGWSAVESSGANVKITSDNGFEEIIELPSDLTEFTLTAELGTTIVYTIVITDKFGDSSTFTVTVDLEPPKAGLLSDGKPLDDGSLVYANVALNLEEEGLTVVVYKDGELYEFDGGEFTEVGSYVVRLTDAVGNETTFSFKIAPKGTNMLVLAFVAAFLAVIALVIVITVLVIRKKRKRENG